ncbi:hypothetical protein MBLNU13_g06125t2 [Cladosporium sp. NU13]
MSTKIFSFRPPPSQPQHHTPPRRAEAGLDDLDTPLQRQTYHPFTGTEDAKFLIPQSTMPTPLLDAENKFAHREQDLKPSYHFNAENTITLLVGAEKQRMVVHSGYLTRTSEFFASALKKEWIEGQTRTIDLDEETPELMAHYLDWVYTTHLPSKGLKSFMTENSKAVIHELLADLFVLGERRLDSRLRNAIVAEFIRLRLIFHDISKCQPSRRVSCINTIYQGTPVGSPARRLMVDLSLRSGCPKCYTADDLDKAFLVDLTQAFFAAVHGPKGIEEQRLLVPESKDYRV